MQRILIAGAGLMGRGIGRLFGAAGHEITFFDRDESLPSGPFDIVIESVVEEFDVKRDVFAKLQATFGAAPIYATNTSGLSIDAIAQGMPHPERIGGLHFFHPADVFPMIEVIRATATEERVVTTLVELVTSADRTPIMVERPVLGAVINRLQHAILHEAYHLLQDGVATAATIDAVAKSLLGPRLCVNGLIEQKDLGGLRMHADAQRSIVPSLSHTSTPAPILQTMVERGDLGIATGQGFYDWTGVDTAALVAERRRQLEELLAFLAAQSAPETVRA